MKPPEIIETSRLRLRRPVMEDAEAIFDEYAQDAEVTKYLSWRPHKSVESTREFLTICAREWEQGKWFFQWVVTRKEDRRLMGMVGIKLDGHKAELAIFWRSRIGAGAT